MFQPKTPGASRTIWQARTAFRGRPTVRVYPMQTYVNGPVYYGLRCDRTVRGKYAPILLTNDHSPEPLIAYAKAELCATNL